LDKKVLSGILCGITLIVAVSGVMIYNLQNPNTTGINTHLITSDNQNPPITTATHYKSNNLQSSITTPSGNTQLNPTSTSVWGHWPRTEPTSKQMHRIISLFDQYVESRFLNASEAGLPGSAVAIVKDGEIIYMNCLGVRDLESGAPVTPDTLFMIGSCTKAFAATNVAQQVDKGLMNWNDTITKYYPDPNEFLLYDSAAYNSINISNCLMHSSGLPAHSGDMEWMYFNDNYSKSLYNTRYIKNTTAIGTTHQYNNIIYALPGYCAARATGTSWGDLIKEELLTPLGMKTATTNSSDYLNSLNHATCYMTYDINGSVIVKPFIPQGIDAVGPAGSMGCSIKEMTNWLKFQLADTGMFNGQRIVSKKNLDATRTGYIYIDDNNDTMYGYGWDIDKDRISHAGDSESSKTAVCVWPAKGLGLVIVTNEGNIGQAYRDSLLRKFFDLLKGNETTDYWPIYYETFKPQPIPDPVDYKGPGDLNSYTGVYFNDFY